MSDTLRAIHFPEQGVAEFIDEPMPECGPGQVLVRSEYTGMTNGTERSFLMGGPYGPRKWPCRCGYQTVGIIEQVGPDVTGYQVGDRVFNGNFKHHASHLRCNVADLDSPTQLTAVLPPEVDPTHAALFGVGGVSMHDVRRARTSVGDRVLVVGAGVIGQFAAQIAQALGAETVLANTSTDRLEVAQQAGVRQTVHITGDDPWPALADPGFDVVIEDSGAEILNDLLAIMRPGGRLFLCAGRFAVNYKCLLAQSRRIEIHHTTHFRRDDLLQLVRLAAAGAINVGPMIRDVVPVSQAPAIYQTLRDHPRKLLGTVFDWSQV